MNTKMRSRKFWFTVWATVMVTYIIVRAIETAYDATWMTAALAVLIAIPAGYVAIGSAKKKKEE